MNLLANRIKSKNKILLVDDSLTDRMLTRKILENYKYKILESESGDYLVELAEQEKPDLILLDIVLPGNNGYEICRKLKQYDQTRSIPVIFVSCRNQPSDIYWGKLQGADGFVAKPYEPVDLINTVEKFLDNETAG